MYNDLLSMYIAFFTALCPGVPEAQVTIEIVFLVGLLPFF